MPNIKLVNIRFNLEHDDRDIAIHDALYQYPNGDRNRIIKEALHQYLISGDDGRGSAQPMPCRQERKLAATPKAQARSAMRDGLPQGRTPAMTESAQPEQRTRTAENSKADESTGTAAADDQQALAGLRRLFS